MSAAAPPRSRAAAWPLKDPKAIVPVEVFVAESRRLLGLERDAEIDARTADLTTAPDADLEARGLSLLSLKVTETSAGLFGRSVVVLGDWAGRLLPAHRFGVGDIVGIRPLHGGGGAVKHDVTGIVSRVGEMGISVTVDEAKGDAAEDALDALPDRVRMDLLANDITYQRISHALGALGSYNFGPASRLVNILYGTEEPHTSPPSPVVPFRQGLNAPQLDAIAMALAAADVSLIHGPPGTGKTTTVVELIRQAVARGDRVLAVAPSNVAVDNIVERLAVRLPGSNVKVVRVGHPARMSPAVLDHCLDAQVKASEGTAIVEDVRVELNALAKERSKSRDKSRRRELQAEERRLKREIRAREEQVVKSVIKSANVVCTTNVGAASKVIQQVFGAAKRKGTASATADATPPLFFDLVVIDEAAQAIEASCWIPLLLGRKCVLAGDHLQLPPTVTSPAAEEQGFNVTMVDRIAARFKSRVDLVSMLTIQYRMNTSIMGWSSAELYDGRLTADESVATHLLTDLPQWRPAGVVGGGDGGLELADDLDAVVSPMLLIDTAGCGIEEVQEISTESKANPGEARIVRMHVLLLLKSGLRPQDIAVITPYNAQVGLLRSMLVDDCPAVEVRSVDGFQGQEREAVVLSFVRSNVAREVGFLSDHRRINVAITRAKRHVAVVADSDTVSSDPFLKRLMMYMNEHGVVRSAAEFDDVMRVGVDGGDGLTSARIDEVSARFMASSAGSKARRPEARVAQPASMDDPRRKALSAFFSKQLSVLSNTVATLTSKRKDRAAKITFPFPAIPDAEVPMDKLALVGMVSRMGDTLQLVFPPSLSSFDRMLVHDAATMLGLAHDSTGEGSDRRILVTVVLPPPKPVTEPQGPAEVSSRFDGLTVEHSDDAVDVAPSQPPPAVTAPDTVPSSPTVTTEALPPGVVHEPVPEVVDVARPETVTVTPPPPDIKPTNMLAALAAERAARAKSKGVVAPPPPPAAGLTGGSGTAKAGKSKKGTGASKGPTDKTKYLGVACVQVKALPTVEDDDDALLDALITDSKVCAATGCKKSILTLSCLCAFCKLRFCYTHGQAEAHGCGDDARASAKDAWRSAHSGASAGKPLAGWQRSCLETQLKKKIDETTAKRMPKVDDDKEKAKKGSGTKKK